MQPSPQRLTREELLRFRINSLKSLADQYEGRWNYLIETRCYSILETHQSRRRVLWNYLLFALDEFWYFRIRANVLWYGRLWWLRYARRLSEAEIAAVLEDDDFESDQEFVRQIQQLSTEGRIDEDQITGGTND